MDRFWKIEWVCERNSSGFEDGDKRYLLLGPKGLGV